RLELPIDARIPDDYIDSERLRLEAYQKLSAAATAAAAQDAIDLVIEELTDRYGEPPAEVSGLVEVARLRRRAALSQLSDVVAMGKNLRIAPAHLPDSMQVRLKRLHPGSKLLAGGDALVVPLPTVGGEPVTGSDLIAWVRQLLDALFPLAD
ncbi:MAG: TRCF domain-containing protein, partial [Microbacterium gubbeenense]